MYEDFFRIKSKPFSLLPDPDFLYMSGRHSIGLSLLEYSLTGQAGFCVITGEVGSGKTTLIRAFMGKIGREFTVGLISNTHSAIADVGAWAMFAFGQKPQANNPAEVYQELMAFLIAEYGAGRQCVLVVDEAQNLSVAALEELRLLSNINSGKDLLLQIILVGQPELLEKLKRPDLRQFAQRIAVSHHLTPFNFAETRSYIQHRLEVAGTTEPIFTDMAVGAIQYFSGGIPRLINSICDLSMVYAFANGARLVTDELVFRVISDRQLSGIAPFAHSVALDDAALRKEIQSLTPEAAIAPAPIAPSAAEPSVAPPAADPASAPSLEILQVNPAPTQVAASADAIEPEPNPEPVKPMASGNVALMADPSLRAPSSPPQDAVVQRGDYFFNEPDVTDLLLTAEVLEMPAGKGLNGRTAGHPSESPIHSPAKHGAQPSLRRSKDDSLGTTSGSVGLQSSSRQGEGVGAAVRTANHGFRHAGSERRESVFAAANPGTNPSERRSWWRRALLGGN